MVTRDWAANNLAARLLAGPWTPEAIAAGITSVLGVGYYLTRKALVVRLAALGEGTYPPAFPMLTAYLIRSEYFRPQRGRPVATVLDAPRFTPATPFAGLQIPVLATPGQLAEWLGLSPEHRDWLTGERGGHGRTVKPALQRRRPLLGRAPHLDRADRPGPTHRPAA